MPLRLLAARSVSVSAHGFDQRLGLVAVLLHELVDDPAGAAAHGRLSSGVSSITCMPLSRSSPTYSALSLLLFLAHPVLAVRQQVFTASRPAGGRLVQAFC